MPSSRPSCDDLDRPVGGEHRPRRLAHHDVRAQLRAVEGVVGLGGAHDPAQGQDFGAGHVLDELADIVVGGRADQFVTRAALDHLAVAHDEDAIAELERLGQVVGDEHHGLADLVVQADDLVLHVAADQRVERGERLVEEEHVRVAGERPGETDALLHAAGELVGVGVLVSGQADQFDDLHGPLGALGLAHAAYLQAVRDVVDDPAVRQQPEVLEDHGELAAPQLAQPFGVRAADVLALEVDFARGGFDQPGETSHQRGLAGAGQAHDDEDLAGRHVEVHIPYGGGASRAVHELAAREPAQLLGIRHLVGLRARTPSTARARR